MGRRADGQAGRRRRRRQGRLLHQAGPADGQRQARRGAVSAGQRRPGLATPLQGHGPRRAALPARRPPQRLLDSRVHLTDGDHGSVPRSAVEARVDATRLAARQRRHDAAPGGLRRAPRRDLAARPAAELITSPWSPARSSSSGGAAYGAPDVARRKADRGPCLTATATRTVRGRLRPEAGAGPRTAPAACRGAPGLPRRAARPRRPDPAAARLRTGRSRSDLVVHPRGRLEGDESTRRRPAASWPRRPASPTPCSGPCCGSAAAPSRSTGGAGSRTSGTTWARTDRTATDTGGQTDLERRSVSGLRWWTSEELSASHETVYPTRLAGLLRTLLDEGPPAAPVLLETERPY